MDAGFVTGVAHRAHDVASTAPDVGAGQERAVQQRSHAVVLDDGRPLHLSHESAAEDALDRAARVIGTDREQERRANTVLAEELDQARNALTRSAERVDVDFQPELHDWFQSTSARASATCERYASKICSNA